MLEVRRGLGATLARCLAMAHRRVGDGELEQEGVAMRTRVGESRHHPGERAGVEGEDSDLRGVGERREEARHREGWTGELPTTAGDRGGPAGEHQRGMIMLGKGGGTRGRCRR